MSRKAPARQEQGRDATPRWPASFPAIWQAIAAIRPGCILSYGEVARRAGLPGRARLVAQALRAAPDEMDLPWHRVLRAGGRIAFPPDTAAFAEQRRALLAEGVEVDARGRARSQVDEDDDLDAMLWRPVAANRFRRR